MHNERDNSLTINSLWMIKIRNHKGLYGAKGYVLNY